MARFSFYDFAGLEKDGDSGTDTYPKPGFSYPPQCRRSSPNAHFGTRKKIVLGEIALLKDFGTALYIQRHRKIALERGIALITV